MFYVVEIDPQTGILLTKDHKRANGDAHWYPFESQARAEAFCAERLLERPDSGWAVFQDDRTTCLGEHTNREPWGTRSRSPKRSASVWQRLRARFTR